MSRQLLSMWLELPESPWPPNHYALLGLEPGAGDMDEIEQRALERMEKLRHHQLMHPEQVTEGMNLLAKAMNCLTELDARLLYDQSLGLRSQQRVPSNSDGTDEIPVAPLIEVPAPSARPPRQTRTGGPVAAPASPPKTEVYSLEDSKLKVEERPGRITPLPEDIIIPELAEPEPLPLPEEELAEDEEALPEEDKSPAPEKPQPSTPQETKIKEERAVRRKIYADIVRIRRVLQVWERLSVFLEDPNEAFTRRTATNDFMACLGDLRLLLPTVSDFVGGPNEPGGYVATLARQQQPLKLFQQLLPSQRGSVASDCRAAHDQLLRRYRRLREEVRKLTAKSFGRRVWRPMFRAMIARPEWILLIMGLLALAIAFFNSLK